MGYVVIGEPDPLRSIPFFQYRHLGFLVVILFIADGPGNDSFLYGKRDNVDQGRFQQGVPDGIRQRVYVDAFYNQLIVSRSVNPAGIREARLHAAIGGDGQVREKMIVNRI